MSKSYTIEVVDLNNKERSSSLLLMMKRQKKEKTEDRMRMKAATKPSKLLFQTQQSIPNSLLSISSSSCSSMSPKSSPISSSNSSQTSALNFWQKANNSRNADTLHSYLIQSNNLFFNNNLVNGSGNGNGNANGLIKSNNNNYENVS